MKVLVADDDPLSRHLIGKILVEAHYEPICVEDGEGAWKHLSCSDPPVLTVLDWMMPKGDGPELCRRIRNRGSADYTYIILLTARTSKVDMLAALSAGADDYLTKPFNRDELIARVQIGERVLQKEARLTRITHEWRAMLDTLPFGVASLGPKGELKRINRTFVEQLGYEIKTLLGKNLAQVICNFEDFQGVMACISGHESFDKLPVSMRKSDGSARPLFLWGRPIDRQDGIVFELITNPE